jgi:hypothetical protein
LLTITSSNFKMDYSLEWDQQCQQLNGHLIAVPWPDDEYLRGVPNKCNEE